MTNSSNDHDPWNWLWVWILLPLWRYRKFLYSLFVVIEKTKERKMLPSQVPTAAPEVIALGSAINDFLSALKSGKSVLEAAQSAEGDALAAATGGITNLPTDLKLAHNQAYLAWAIASAYETP